MVRQILGSTKKTSLDSQVGPGSYNVGPVGSGVGFKIHEAACDRFGEKRKQGQIRNTTDVRSLDDEWVGDCNSQRKDITGRKILLVDNQIKFK